MISNNYKSKKISEGWIDNSVPFGYGSRKDYLEKDNIQIVYNLFGSGYANITIDQVTNSFKAVEEYKNNSELTQQVRKYDVDYLLYNNLTDVESKIRKIIEDLEIEKKEYVELI